jgi:hypothetical protein
MKNAVKVKERNREGFRYQQRKFPRIGYAKTKEKIFFCPQNNHLMNDRNFDEKVEEATCEAMRFALTNV